jgi:geranylgeranyl reductase family protein
MAVSLLHPDYDLIVVGGGPAGCAVARDVASAGFRVLVAEEHARVGEPLQCSGLISARTLEISRVSPQVVQRSLHGARVHAPSGQVLDLTDKKSYALAIDRVAFDQDLASQARDAGAELLTGTRVDALDYLPGGVRLSLGGQSVVARLVVGADGHNSLVARWLGLSAPPERVPMFAAEVELPGYDDRVVDIFLGRMFAPGWFGWVIPTGNGTARVGTGSSGRNPGGGALPRPRQVFEHLKETHPGIFRGLRIVKTTGGVAPIGMRDRTYGERALLVGDAACHVKPISGGGLYFGLKAAGICAGTVVAALVAENCSEAFLSGYQRAWESTIGLEVQCGLRHREVFLGMDDREMDNLISFFNNPYWRRLVLKHGDLDHHSVIAGKLAMAPPWAQRFMQGGLKALLGCMGAASLS